MQKTHYLQIFAVQFSVSLYTSVTLPPMNVHRSLEDLMYAAQFPSQSGTLKLPASYGTSRMKNGNHSFLFLAV